MMESQGMSTEGTSLEGVLQQEREALEQAAIADEFGEEANSYDLYDQSGSDDTQSEATA